MTKISTQERTVSVSDKLADANISYYKIAQIIEEPQSTIQNIFKGHNKYSEGRVSKILDKIDLFLSSDYNNNIVDKMIEYAPEDPDLFIRLYALGLDSKTFTPDEKYKLAVEYKRLTDLKK